MKPIIILMGVCGCGKSTLGQLLAQKTGGKFVEGDDFHPPRNVEKMSQSIPLNDADRQGWLERLAEVMREADDGSVFLACSALKERYRKILQEASPDRIKFVFLQGSREVLKNRLASRTAHYMPPELLDSQLETLEIPDSALALDIEKSPEELVHEILKIEIREPR